MLRFVDAESDPSCFPLDKEHVTNQLLSLQQALEPVIPRIDQLDNFIKIAKTKCHFPSEHGLTLNESAAIFLYTMKWDDNSFYQVIQKDLRSKDQSTSKSWLFYLQLFNTAIQKLPNNRMNVWRGMNEDISKKLKKDDEFIWWSITSCSSSDNVIRDFIGSNSTFCLIEAVNGKDISVYSSTPNQNEIILCPGTQLHVVSNAQDQTSLSVLHLREIDQPASWSFRNNGVVKTILLPWGNNRVISLALHFIVLMAALLLVTVVGKSFATFASSHITTVLVTPLTQFMQMIFPSKNGLDRAAVMKKISIYHIHVDPYGNRFQGEWKDNKKHGDGKMDYANGNTYIGEWVDDMATGEGIFIWTNGDQYDGQMKNGQRHGRGSYNFANGDRYTGDWIQDKKVAYGISSVADGKYEGQFQDDKMHGNGSFDFVNGDSYIGDWVDNKQEGQGILKWANGDRYEGGFKAGKQDGEGSYYFANENKFVGEWVDGERMTDHGAFTWAGKNRERKEVKDDEKQEEPNMSDENPSDEKREEPKVPGVKHEEPTMSDENVEVE